MYLSLSLYIYIYIMYLRGSRRHRAWRRRRRERSHFTHEATELSGRSRHPGEGSCLTKSESRSRECRFRGPHGKRSPWSNNVIMVQIRCA